MRGVKMEVLDLKQLEVCLIKNQCKRVMECAAAFCVVIGQAELRFEQQKLSGMRVGKV
jgi:hypothetical protein